MTTIEAPAEVTIEIPDEILNKANPDEEEKPTEKAASPPTLEMVIARIDSYASKVDQLSAKLDAFAPKEEVEKEEPKEEPEEKPVEKVTISQDMIDEAVKKFLEKKLESQPVQKRSTAVEEKPTTFETPMDIPVEAFIKGDPKSLLKLGGYKMGGK